MLFGSFAGMALAASSQEMFTGNEVRAAKVQHPIMRQCHKHVFMTHVHGPGFFPIGGSSENPNLWRTIERTAQLCGLGINAAESRAFKKAPAVTERLIHKVLSEGFSVPGMWWTSIKRRECRGRKRRCASCESEIGDLIASSVVLLLWETEFLEQEKQPGLGERRVLTEFRHHQEPDGVALKERG
ncbi:hypothetical protein BGY98DRAFT_936762 [Russula aff. rugulosa BPL654]|nr:hypothetical protein BGY98DRAFT_936762 [Russula aff. rugulosa BPL654]